MNTASLDSSFNFSLKESFRSYLKETTQPATEMISPTPSPLLKGFVHYSTKEDADNKIKMMKDTPIHFLKTLINEQATGKVTIHNPLDEFVSWQIYVGNGKIHFANSGTGARERLNYLLGIYLNNPHLNLPQQIGDDYQYLCQLWKQGLFSFQQVRSLLNQCTQEALVQILSLPKTSCSFDPNSRLDHLILNLDLEQTFPLIKQKIRYWWELRSDISSPFQRPLVPTVESWERIGIFLAKQESQGHHWVRQLNSSLKNSSCLYEIAGQMQISTLKLALILRPLLRSGEIDLLSYQEIQADNRPLVACIDPNLTNQRIVKFTLEESGFKVSNIESSVDGLTRLLNQKPKLVLMNAEMADINGYQLCGLCRRATTLKDIPIIILTEQDTLVSRLKTKLSGASGYLCKPFLPQELVKLVNSRLVQVTA